MQLINLDSVFAVQKSTQMEFEVLAAFILFSQEFKFSGSMQELMNFQEERKRLFINIVIAYGNVHRN